MRPTTRLRELMAEGTVIMPGAYDAITARLVEAAGFDAFYLSGAGVTNSLTGMPDVGLLTMSEMARQARYACAAVEIPCLADADTGYGDALSAARAVHEMEAAGLAGIHIEDQLFPKRCGHLEGKELVPPDEMAAKIAAAVQARTDPDFLLVARTDARAVTGLDDAVARARLYVEAGADAIFPEALETPHEFALFGQEIQAPLLANMTEFGRTPYLTVDDFTAMGYRLVIFPMTVFRVVMKAAQGALTELRERGTQRAILGRMQTRAELYELIRYRPGEP